MPCAQQRSICKRLAVEGVEGRRRWGWFGWEVQWVLLWKRCSDRSASSGMWQQMSQNAVCKVSKNQSKFRSWEVGLGQGQWCTKVARMIGSGSCSKHWRQQKKNNDCREKRRQASKAKREETRNQKRSRGEATSQSRPRQAGSGTQGWPPQVPRPPKPNVPPLKCTANKKKEKTFIIRWTNLLNKSLASADRNNKATLLRTALRSIQVVCKGFTPANISNAIRR